ncbi:putative hemicentin-2-like [Triplophysa rosa]|uniref:Hemicentin-2-like n=1 Tax=Triplophysa rosa TaxID=992332 RepID=A0A9W7TJP7_TRIRA|nr:putative hemicentin-2-like [Triplophysa rosa]
MRLVVWAFTLSVVLAGKEKHTYRYLTAACKDDINLPCDALQNSQRFTSVTWYKVHNATHSSVLINEKNIFTPTDKKQDSVSLGNNASLILWKAAPANSGTFECCLHAKVGYKNSHSFITINISDCMSTTLPYFEFSTQFTNSTNLIMNMSTPLTHMDKNADLFIMLAYLGVALSKLLLSVLCIWVLHYKNIRKRVFSCFL